MKQCHFIFLRNSGCSSQGELALMKVLSESKFKLYLIDLTIESQQTLNRVRLAFFYLYQTIILMARSGQTNAIVVDKTEVFNLNKNVSWSGKAYADFLLTSTNIAVAVIQEIIKTILMNQDCFFYLMILSYKIQQPLALFLIIQLTLMEEGDQISIPKNGYFKSREDLQKFYRRYKEKYDLAHAIPIILEQLTQGKGMFLFLVKPELSMNIVLSHMLRIVVIQHKQMDEGFKEYSAVKIMDKQTKNIINPDDKEYSQSAQNFYDQTKDEKGFIHYLYQFSKEKEEFFQVEGLYIVPMVLLAIPAVPFLMIQHLYNWTSDKIANMRNPSIHQFKFKQRNTFQQRVKLYEKNQRIFHNHVSIVLERHMKSTLPEQPPKKLSASRDIRFRQLQVTLHKIIFKDKEVKERQGKVVIFFMIGGKIPDQDAMMNDIYDKYKEQDNIVYMTYQEQERF